MWGFTVDDALISVRYARHLAAGIGWRFNADGPSTDGVTPLPWPVVLAPLANGDPLAVLGRAKALGLVACGIAGGALGAAVGEMRRADVWARGAALLTLALSLPVAAHTVSGMETALAMALATLAVTVGGSLSNEPPRVRLASLRFAPLLREPHRRLAPPFRAAALAGAAASFRPEMAPWATVLAVGFAVVARRGPLRSALAGAVALVPFSACALLRAAAWGRPAPLALMAKPSDVDHGLAYAGAACVVTLVPLLVLAPIALRRAPAAVVVVAAAVAHVAAIIMVGGDWMPYARLMVPVIPSLAWAAARIAEHAHPAATASRALVALSTGAWLLAHGGTRGRRVGPDRAALVAAAHARLGGFSRVASLDVGWVGAATEAHVIDLAGVTDPVIAALPGGHTSKRIDATLLFEQRPDAVLLYISSGLPGGLGSWRDATYTRILEARLASDAVVASHFTATDWLPLGPDGAGYVLLAP
jgi:hypothetical protein